MVTYVINRTDINAPTINVAEKTVDQTLPIAIFGRQKLEYGELMNENILHLLENFACPEDPSNPGNPLFSSDPVKGALDHTLQNAIDGQLWYNITNELLYLRVDGVWVPLSMFNEVAANYGTIAHGEHIPLPVSSTGATFTYEECSWMVGPYNYPSEIDLMRCYTSTDDAQVTMQYSVPGSTSIVNGVANYMIIGIRGNKNKGDNDVVIPPQLSPTATPPPTVTPTSTFGTTITTTPTQTPTATVTPTVTPSMTRTPAATPPPSVSLLGSQTRLYMSYTPGWSADIEPGSSSYRRDTCGSLIDPAQYPEPANSHWQIYYYNAMTDQLELYIRNISGGIPPYTVDFSGVSFETSTSATAYMQLAGDPTLYNIPPTYGWAQYTDAGNSSGSTPVRTGIPSGSSARMTVRLENQNSLEDDWYDPATTSYLGQYIEMWGVVNIKDQSGQSRNWWITSTPTPVGGSNINSPPSGGVSRWGIYFNHYYSCNDCPPPCTTKVIISV